VTLIFIKYIIISDYAPVPELDVYDKADLASDDGDIGMTVEQRRAAESIIDARIRERQNRKDQRFLESGMDEDDESINEREDAIKLPDRGLDGEDDSDDEFDEGKKEYREQEVNLENRRTSERMDRTSRY